MNKILQKLLDIRFILLLFVILSLPLLELPGLQMDAGNPDYYALHILHPDKVPIWCYPDNVLSTMFTGDAFRFPLLNSLYGTNLPAYIYLLFSRFLGSSIASVRILHLLYSVAILFLFHFLLQHTTHSGILSSVCILLLAIDPSMVFAPRTRFYLQLFPYLFFVPGLLIMVNQLKALAEKRQNNLHIFGACLLMGLGASSYFIFAGYCGAVFLVLCLSYFIFKPKKLTTLLASIVGFVTGYLPFLYAHASILLQTGFQGWLDAMKAMSGAYGISEGQVSIITRFLHFFEILASLSGGNSILIEITGQSIGNLVGTVYVIIFLLLFAASIYLLFRVLHKDKKTFFAEKDIILLAILDVIFFVHFVLAMIVGNSLMYQHYIMLLPVMYLISAITLFRFISSAPPNLSHFIYSSRLHCCVLLLLTILLITRTGIIYHHIALTDGGIEYYSGAVNEIGEYLDNITTDQDVIICPQWGYWMGTAIITEGQKTIWNDTTSENIIVRVLNNEKASTYYLVSDNITSPTLLKEILQSTNLEIERVIPFSDYGNILEPQIIVLHN